VPVEFLTDERLPGTARTLPRSPGGQMETLFFLDDEDRTLVGKRRGDHMRLGFALQFVTVRHLGTFLNDPLDVPTEVLDYIAQQLEVTDPSCVKRYLERRPTRFEHAEEIKRVLGLTDFGDAESELAAWIDARAWTTGGGPKAIFLDAVGRLRKQGVLLPGVTTLARLVARVRDEATQRLFDTLATMPSPQQRSLLEQSTHPGRRCSRRWRPATSSGQDGAGTWIWDQGVAWPGCHACADLRKGSRYIRMFELAHSKGAAPERVDVHRRPGHGPRRWARRRSGAHEGHGRRSGGVHRISLARGQGPEPRMRKGPISRNTPARSTLNLS